MTEKKARISAIAAIGKDTRAICEDGHLMWHIPEDMKRLRSLTLGHVLVMGRKTYDSIGHPLKGRVNIIVTRNNDYLPKIPADFINETVVVCHSIEGALEKAEELEQPKEAGKEREIFIFGGGEIYAAALAQTERLYLTLVEDAKKGTACFPDYGAEFTKVIEESERQFWESGNGPIPYHWIDLEREK